MSYSRSYLKAYFETDVFEGEIKFVHTTKALHEIGKDWVKAARRELDKHDKNATGGLRKSLEHYIGVRGSYNFYVGLKGADHAKIVEWGVQGAGPYIPPKNPSGKSTKKYENRAPKSPFKFGSGKSKGSIYEGIRNWLGVKKFQFRDDRGRFMSYDQMTYPITRNVWQYGIEPTPYLSAPIDKLLRKANSAIGIAFAKDIANFLDKDVFSEKIKIEFTL